MIKKCLEIRASLKIIINYIEGLLKLVLLIASLLGIWQYFDLKQEARIKQTMSFLNQFNESHMREAKLNLEQVWTQYYEKINLINKHSVPSVEQKKSIQSEFVLYVIRHHEIQNDIRLLINFFDSLAICIQEGICDKETSRTFFEHYANRFLCLHEPWIEDQRIKLNDVFFAAYLQGFVLYQNKTSC